MFSSGARFLPLASDTQAPPASVVKIHDLCSDPNKHAHPERSCPRAPSRFGSPSCCFNPLPQDLVSIELARLLSDPIFESPTQRRGRLQFSQRVDDGRLVPHDQAGLAIGDELEVCRFGTG